MIPVATLKARTVLLAASKTCSSDSQAAEFEAAAAAVLQQLTAAALTHITAAGSVDAVPDLSQALFQLLYCAGSSWPGAFTSSESGTALALVHTLAQVPLASLTVQHRDAARACLELVGAIAQWSRVMADQTGAGRLGAVLRKLLQQSELGFTYSARVLLTSAVLGLSWVSWLKQAGYYRQHA
jgi:hypothetical protein